MTDALVPALIPYDRFLECLERRSAVRLELARQDAQRARDAEAVLADATLNVMKSLKSEV
jgi:hypothetical protein